MNKRINVVLENIPDYSVSDKYYYEKLRDNEYPHIYLDHEITSEELNNAIRVITTYFMQNGSYMITTDLDEMNSSLAPAKEMTLEEIEKILGHKVKVVNEKQEK